MELTISTKEFKEPFNKLLSGLIEGDDLEYFTVDKGTKTISFMLGDWNVSLNNDGTWEIS